jgi:hypothetical protein
MKPKPLLKEDILRAMRHTRSNMAAARHLGVSYQHYKPYAKLFKDENGLSLFDKHKNQCGRGIPKHLKGDKNEPALDRIINGELDSCHFTPEKIKNRLIIENRIAEDCHKCGMNERRVLDYKIPLLLNFKDGNKKNYALSNLELLCYNCYFLHIGDVFTPEQLDSIEDVPRDTFKINKPEFDLNEEHLDNMRSLGIM